MSDDLERAQKGIEDAHEAHERHGDSAARTIAVLISVLAAGLAIAEMQEKSSQNRYMAAHIQVSDDFAFYQAKTVRMNLYTTHAETLAALPNASEPTIQKEIADARANAKRIDTEKGTGRRDLLAQAAEHKDEREHYAHRYELFEIVVGALQIAIVLASVSVVTRMRPLAVGAGLIGAAAIVAGILVHFGMI